MTKYFTSRSSSRGSSMGSRGSRGSRGCSKGSKNCFFESKWFYALLAIVLLISAVLFFYTVPVENFSNPKTLEYFYMKTCPHCEEFTPIWEEAVTKIKEEGLAVTTKKHNMNDEDTGSARAEFFGIKAAPTVLYVFGPEKTDMTEYDGPRTADAIVAYVKAKLTTSGQ